jgi:hypothetical protein
MDEARPHKECPTQVVLLVLQQECSVEATSEQRDRRPCVCSLMMIAHGGIQVST